MKLELKYLISYLPYKLKGNYTLSDVIRLMESQRDEVRKKELAEDCVKFFRLYCKPILRPLSDLTKEIDVNGEKFIPVNELAKKHIDWFHGDSDLIVECEVLRQFNLKINWKCNEELFYNDDLFIMTVNHHLNKYWVMEKFFEWHFDVYGLIEKGLAIDTNTLNK